MISPRYGKVNTSVRYFKLWQKIWWLLKKEGVDDSVEALSASAKASTNTFSKLVLNIVQSSEAVEQNVEQILSNLHFHETTRKEIEAATIPLSQISTLSNDIIGKFGGVDEKKSAVSNPENDQLEDDQKGVSGDVMFSESHGWHYKSLNLGLLQFQSKN